MFEVDAPIAGAVRQPAAAQAAPFYFKHRGSLDMILKLGIDEDGNVDAVSAGEQQELLNSTDTSCTELGVVRVMLSPKITVEACDSLPMLVINCEDA